VSNTKVLDHGMPPGPCATALREACLSLNNALRASAQDFVYVLAVVPLDRDGVAGEALMGSNMRPEEAQGLIAVLAAGRSATEANEKGVPQ